MRRILLDTSIYGKLIEEPEIIEVLNTKIPNKIIIYGNNIIRKELRDTPKYVRYAGKNLRILLLTIYSNLVKDHELEQNKLVETLAKDYQLEYRKIGGSVSSIKMRNDFLIIAIATIYQLDIVVSDDEKTMFSSISIKAYRSVNKSYGLKDPEFVPYRIFKKNLKNQEDFPV